MAVKEASLTERVQSSYRQLSLAAINLNVASDELGRAISALEAALKKLKLGISAWTRISGADNQDEGHWWSRDIGYTDIRNEWVLALRSCSGQYDYPPGDSENIWPFNQAPRWMQVEAVGKVPDLIERLISQANDTTLKLKTKTRQAYELAAAVSEVSEQENDWCTKLQAAMSAVGFDASAEALADPQVEVWLVENELKIKAPKRYEAALGSDEMHAALELLECPDLPYKVRFVSEAKKTADQKRNGGKQ